MKNVLFLFLTASTLAFANDPWSGADYNKNSEEQRAAAERILSSLSFGGEEKILDIGCGDGYLTSRMGEQLESGSVVGLDLSPSMIEFASSHFKSERSQFRLLDARLLDYEEQFDLVTSFTTLHWIPEQLQVLQGIEKALRSGGKFIADLPCSLPKPMAQAVEEVMSKEEWVHAFDGFKPGWRFFTAEEYQNLLEEANLQPLKILQLPVPQTFPSKTAFIGFLKQWFPYLRALPQEKKGVFLQQVVDRYLELAPPNEKGQPCFVVSRLHIEAEKL